MTNVTQAPSAANQVRKAVHEVFLEPVIANFTLFVLCRRILFCHFWHEYYRLYSFNLIGFMTDVQMAQTVYIAVGRCQAGTR